MITWCLGLILFLGVGVFGRDAYHLLLFESVVYSSDGFVGRSIRPRFDRDDRSQWHGAMWYADTGFIRAEFEGPRMTVYDREGKLTLQFDGPVSSPVKRAPWLWGKSDQDAPSAPWLSEGISLEEWILRTEAAVSKDAEWRAGI